MKKTAKKLFSLILTMAFLLALLPGAVQAADSLWETQTLDDGTLSITGYRGLAPDIKIPSSIGGFMIYFYCPFYHQMVGTSCRWGRNPTEVNWFFATTQNDVQDETCRF